MSKKRVFHGKDVRQLAAVAAGKRNPTTKHPLRPGDPVAVLGAQPLVNIIETDTDYDLDQNDAIVVCQVALTLTLTSQPLTATPIQVVADGGPVTVMGPIQGG